MIDIDAFSEHEGIPRSFLQPAEDTVPGAKINPQGIKEKVTFGESFGVPLQFGPKLPSTRFPLGVSLLETICMNHLCIKFYFEGNQLVQKFLRRNDGQLTECVGTENRFILKMNVFETKPAQKAVFLSVISKIVDKEKYLLTYFFNVIT